jgi:hypothetical protein
MRITRTRRSANVRHPQARTFDELEPFSFDTIHLMSKTLISFFPDPEPILQLSPEEIAWVILEIVMSWDAERARQNLAAHNFTSSEAAPYTRLRLGRL